MSQKQLWNAVGLGIISLFLVNFPLQGDPPAGPPEASPQAPVPEVKADQSAQEPKASDPARESPAAVRTSPGEEFRWPPRNQPLSRVDQEEKKEEKKRELLTVEQKEEEEKGEGEGANPGEEENFEYISTGTEDGEVIATFSRPVTVKPKGEKYEISRKDISKYYEYGKKVLLDGEVKLTLTDGQIIDLTKWDTAAYMRRDRIYYERPDGFQRTRSVGDTVRIGQNGVHGTGEIVEINTTDTVRTVGGAKLKGYVAVETVRNATIENRRTREFVPLQWVRLIATRDANDVKILESYFHNIAPAEANIQLVGDQYCCSASNLGNKGIVKIGYNYHGRRIDATLAENGKFVLQQARDNNGYYLWTKVEVINNAGQKSTQWWFVTQLKLPI